MHRVILSLGETDCETIGEGFLAQPVNAISSLAFSVVGAIILVWATAAEGWERRFRSVVGILAVLTGIGSLLYHGPQSSGSLFAHDITFLSVLVVIGGTHISLGWRWSERTSWITVMGIIAAYVIVLALWPTVTNVLTGISVVLVVVGDVWMHRIGGIDRLWYALSVTSLAGALVFFLFGRTDALLCAPDFYLQGHGMWHILSAVAVGAYVRATAPARARRERR
jgi:hypothetical protein